MSTAAELLLFLTALLTPCPTEDSYLCTYTDTDHVVINGPQADPAPTPYAIVHLAHTHTHPDLNTDRDHYPRNPTR